MTLLRSLLLAFFTAAAAVGCTPGPSLSDPDADIAGTLTELIESPASSPPITRVMVQRDQAPESRSIVHVESGTRIYIVETGGALRPASADDLATGDVLHVWTTGIQLRSDPPQVFAVRIHILR